MTSAKREWSNQQLAVFDWFEHPTRHAPNAIVEALAGTGKTTTIIEGVNRAPEDRILLCAFNKRIAVELQSRLRNPNAEAATLHSVGYRAVRQAWPRIRMDDNSTRYRKYDLSDPILLAYCQQTGRRLQKADRAFKAVSNLIAQLHTKVREVAPWADDLDTIIDVAEQFDLTPDDGAESEGWTREVIADLALLCVRKATERPVGGIDYADMLFLPVRNQMLRPMYDLVVVDECQDMNAAQLIIARGVLKPGGRMCVVGDPHQAIYAFRGADSTSMARLEGELQAEKLSLTVTYRCGQAVVAEAKRLVPAFEAHSTNQPGLVRSIAYDQLFDEDQGAMPGSFVLSRLNAPLVKVCFQFLRQGVPARIEGRDIGQGLRQVIEAVGKDQAAGYGMVPMATFYANLRQWQEAEVTRAVAENRESKAALVMDKYDTILALADGADEVQEVLRRIERLFADDVQKRGGAVVCSSVHKAKGLEAAQVFLLTDTLYKSWSRGAEDERKKKRRQQEEANIEYVGITRAIGELVKVEGLPGEKQERGRGQLDRVAVDCGS